MLEPSVLTSELSNKLISLLEQSRASVEGWREGLAELEKEYAGQTYRHLFFLLTQLEFSTRKAKNHWQKLLQTWEELNKNLGETVDLRVAVLHYFLEVQRELKNPTMVEIKILQQTQDSVIRDELTQLYNFRYFQDRIEHEVKRAIRYASGLSLLMVDIDDFKLFNDRNGHLRGNVALRAMADTLRGCVREVDVVSRYGGEEFAIILPATAKKGALTVGQKIRARVEEAPIPGDGAHAREALTVSVGFANVPTDATSTNDLIERADSALYKAKSWGKNRVEAYSDDRREFARFDAALVGQLRVAYDRSLAITTTNISQGGLLFNSTQSFPVGSLAQLQLLLPPDKYEITCTAKVVRVAERGAEEYEIGVRIINLEADDLFRFRKFLEGLAEKEKAIG